MTLSHISVEWLEYIAHKRLSNLFHTTHTKTKCSRERSWNEFVQLMMGRLSVYTTLPQWTCIILCFMLLLLQLVVSHFSRLYLCKPQFQPLGIQSMSMSAILIQEMFSNTIFFCWCQFSPCTIYNGNSCVNENEFKWKFQNKERIQSIDDMDWKRR